MPDELPQIPLTGPWREIEPTRIRLVNTCGLPYVDFVFEHGMVWRWYEGAPAGEVISPRDVLTLASRWPQFARWARALGLRWWRAPAPVSDTLF